MGGVGLDGLGVHNGLIVDERAGDVGAQNSSGEWATTNIAILACWMPQNSGRLAAEDARPIGLDHQHVVVTGIRSRLPDSWVPTSCG